MGIFENMPSFTTILAVGIPLLYLLGTPILILKTFRAEAFPTIESVDPVDLPDVVRQQFSNAHEQMTAIGFGHEDTFFLPEAVNNVKTLLAYFANREEKVVAISVVIFAQAESTWQVQAQYTEMCTSFADESAICTGNQGTIGAFPIAETNLNTMYPQLKQIADLFRAHQALVRAHGGNRRPILKAIEKFDGDFAASLSSGMTQEYETALAEGYLRYEGGDQSSITDSMKASPYRPTPGASKPSYVATIKGAYLMTWKQIWPFKGIITSRKISHDRKLLERTGFDFN